ncbi:hypothetical protein HYFRA_00013909 [Hymenoscyphus fraxineus]|uniref:ABC transporter domain-containing protein n=1 Tax=Hymenoscyphus fraxineus TaxID=746836 RepID=A0A9N9LC43_9HELO|nr:hypothetical protein HYFRA_00013909 [Hymenoscyphus fraxineus]
MIIQIQRPITQLPLLSRTLRKYTTSASFAPPIIQISNATFYRHHPSSTLSTPTTNPPLFPDFTFSIPFTPTDKYWAIVGRSSTGKTTLLETIGGKHIAIPATARSYPYLEAIGKTPESAIKRVGFDGEDGGIRGGRGAYLSARYESRREGGDWTVEAYLRGQTEMNSYEDSTKKVDEKLLFLVILEMRLEGLLDLSVADLSNGQNRRMRIAKALLEQPEVLLLDEPFAGLDPGSVKVFGELFGEMARRQNPRVVLALRTQDEVPTWVTDVIYLKGNCEVDLPWRGREAYPMYFGTPSEKMMKDLLAHARAVSSEGMVTSRKEGLTVDRYPFDTTKPSIGEALVEMDGAVISYGTRTVLGNWTQKINGQRRKGLYWTLRRGERWGVFGPNGSGKTTLLSLICSDHPKTYSLPIKLFGRSRSASPGNPGLSIFEIQSRIGHSSPEIHHHIPKSLTIRQVLENAWADTPRGIPKLDENAEKRIYAFLQWFRRFLAPQGLEKDVLYSLVWADTTLFGGLSFGAQKLVLFLRALIKSPDIVILDEAFSGMDDHLRNRCLAFLTWGERQQWTFKKRLRPSARALEGQVVFEGLTDRQALVVISHVKEEVPECVREWICLPDAETYGAARVGRFDGPIEEGGRWEEVWGMRYRSEL